MTAASDADLNHLFGIKKPFLAPLHLSIPLNAPRRLTADEAAQILITYYKTGDIPPQYVLRPIEAYTNDGGIIDLRAVAE